MWKQLRSGSSRTAAVAAVVLAGGLAAAGGCVKKLTRELTPAAETGELDGDSKFLKAHMLDGRVYMLTDWRVSGDTVYGTGDLRDANRVVEGTGGFAVPVDGVAIFETNRVSASQTIVAMSVMTLASAGMTVFCAANPKACFGSCPTFYAQDGSTSRLQAEGFSSSVSPALEAGDIDALYRAHAKGGELAVRMTNEALETHVVRHVDVLAVRRREGGRVFATPSGEFREALVLAEATRCQAAEGECSAAVREFDGMEQYSTADSLDLASREQIDLEFESAPEGQLGVVIASRQTLMTTYLFYQTLAYMGASAGTWLAALERSDATTLQSIGGVGDVLGGIEVLVEDEAARWVRAGEVRETGPLATDVRVVPIGHGGGGTVKVRLRLTRGLWRLDWLALAQLGVQLEPERLSPALVLREGEADSNALHLLVDRDAALTTLPGDEYTLIYRLPGDPHSLEFFLESKGYYLEWMRREWLAEEDPARVAMMLFNPTAALRTLAPEYKRVEPHMEEYFWRSRYVRH